MRRLAVLLLLIFSFFRAAVGAETFPATPLDGEAFSKKYVGQLPDGHKLVEFVRDTETFETWTKLIGYRYQHMPRLDNDPIQYALEMRQMIKRMYPKSPFLIIENKTLNQAIVDFLIWPQDGKFVELNLYRFWKSKDGKAVVSVQFAYRFAPPSSAQTEEEVRLATERQMKALYERRQSWSGQIVALNAAQIEAALLAE